MKLFVIVVVWKVVIIQLSMVFIHRTREIFVQDKKKGSR